MKGVESNEGGNDEPNCMGMDTTWQVEGGGESVGTLKGFQQMLEAAQVMAD